MKQLSALFLLVLLASACTKDGRYEPGPPVEYADVPNWQTVFMLADVPGPVAGTTVLDTVSAYTVGTRSYIMYKGIPYKIRAHKGLTAYPVTDTSSEFYITVFDGGDKPVTDCFVSSGMYFRNGIAYFRSQSFRPNKVAPFDNNRTTDYYSR